MSYTLQNLTPRTGTPSSPFPESVFQQSEQLLTGYEPNRIVEDRDSRHFTGDGQFTEHEDLRVRPLSFHQSIMASTTDSTESIATLPESDIHDEQPVQNDRKFIILNEKT